MWRGSTEDWSQRVKIWGESRAEGEREKECWERERERERGVRGFLGWEQGVAEYII